MFSQLSMRSARVLPADLRIDHAHYVKNHRLTRVTQDHCQLANPQVQWVGLSSHISKVIFQRKFKRSLVSFCYSNPVISTCTVFSSSTNHHHRSISSIPVTPEADLVAALDVATTLRLLKPACCLVLTATLNRTASQTSVTRPNLAISKVAITCDFWSKCLSTQTVPCCLQQWRVTGIITACNLKLSTADQPKSWRDHVSIDWRISCCSHGNVLVIPPESIVSHPGLVIEVGKSGDKIPRWALSWDSTIHLRV